MSAKLYIQACTQACLDLFAVFNQAQINLLGRGHYTGNILSMICRQLRFYFSKTLSVET